MPTDLVLTTNRRNETTTANKGNRPMTNALKQYTNENGWNTIRINGRDHYDFGHFYEITPATYEGQTLSSEWIIRTCEHTTYKVYGGVNSGGGRCDWFVEFESGGTIKCKSLVACFREICNF